MSSEVFHGLASCNTPREEITGHFSWHSYNLNCCEECSHDGRAAGIVFSLSQIVKLPIFCSVLEWFRVRQRENPASIQSVLFPPAFFSLKGSWRVYIWQTASDLRRRGFLCPQKATFEFCFWPPPTLNRVLLSETACGFSGLGRQTPPSVLHVPLLRHVSPTLWPTILVSGTF